MILPGYARHSISFGIDQNSGINHMDVVYSAFAVTRQYLRFSLCTLRECLSRPHVNPSYPFYGARIDLQSGCYLVKVAIS